MELFSYLLPLGILLTALAALSVRRFHLVVDPASVFLCIWIVTLALHAFVSVTQVVPLYASSLTANLIVSVAVLAFACAFRFSSGLVIAGQAQSARRTRAALASPRFANLRARGEIWDWLLIGYALLVLALMYARAQAIVGSADVLAQMQLLRTRLNYEAADWGYVAYLALSVSVFAVYVGARNVGLGFRRNALAYALFAVALVIAILSSQRTAVLFVIIGFFFARSARGVPPLRTNFLFVALFLAMFVLLGVLLGKVGALENGDFATNVSDGLDSFLLYLLTPLSAFSVSEVWGGVGPATNITTGFFLRVLDAMGFYGDRIQSPFLEYSFVPSPTNVYTFAHAAVSDFGMGFVFYFALVGLVYGPVFAMGRHSARMRVLQALLYYPLIIAVFSDQWMTIASQWVQVGLYLVAIDRLYKGGARDFTPLRRSSKTTVQAPA